MIYSIAIPGIFMSTFILNAEVSPQITERIVKYSFFVSILLIYGCFYFYSLVSSTTIATLGSGVTDTIESTTQTAISNLSTSLGLTDGINLTTAQTEIGSFSTRSDEMESTESTEIITTNTLIAITTTFESTSISIFDPETTTQPFGYVIKQNLY